MKVERAYLALAEKIREVGEVGCMQSDPDAFFPETGGNSYELQNAKKICQRCPARVECLTYAIEAQEPFGLWGGMTARERIEISRKRRKDYSLPSASSGS
jgi:WhiB family redox-sensing transcriptional regulator